MIPRSRLLCGVVAVKNVKSINHAVAIDESGRIFDPANSAPEPGKFKLRECVEHGTFTTHSCFTIRGRRST
jgi:hypothetical protein